MHENKDDDPQLRDTPDPSTFPIGSPESRAAARFQLENYRHIKACYVEAGPNGEPRECDPLWARVSCFEKAEVTYTRLEGESAQQFEDRIWKDLPMAGPMHIVEFFTTGEAHPYRTTEENPE